jgi:hypothetical protein
MSGTGSLMIRNLRKPNDYSKAIMTQDELLRIAIANDLNVAKARQSFQSGEVQELTPQQSRNPAELQADTELQERTALNNLLELFAYREAGEIIGKLGFDEIFTLNQLFPQIKRDIQSRYNLKLISPAFFIDYLRKFKEEVEASKGVSTNLSTITNKFNDLTDNIKDLRAILPSKLQLTRLKTDLGKLSRDIPKVMFAPVMERLDRLEQNLPSADDFRALSQESSVAQYETINLLQNITANMPTQIQVQKVLDDIEKGDITQAQGFREIEVLVSGVREDQLDALDELKRELAEQQQRGGSPDVFIEESIPVQIPNIPSLAIGRNNAGGRPSGSRGVYIVLANGNSQRQTTQSIKDLFETNEGFKNWCLGRFGRVPQINELMAFISSQSGQFIPSSAVSSITDVETATKSGFGLTRPKLVIAKNGQILAPQKIGKGVDYVAEPNYRELGKYVVNMKQLKDRDILNVKFRSLGRIPQFKPVPISDVFKDYLLDLLENGKANPRIYDQIPVDERILFEKIATGAGIINALKLKRTITDEDKTDNDRFNILKGEYLAGNNSVALMKELRKLVVKFMGQGKILKQDGLNLLIELSV